MAAPGDRRPAGYDAVYRGFDSPAMRRVRREAYDEDIGQHSWVTAAELRRDLARLDLSPSTRILDLGCGPGGPLTFALATTGCRGTGVDVNPAALDLARARAGALGLAHRLELCSADLDLSLPFEAGAFGAAMSLDVVLHLRARRRLFDEAHRVLVPAARLLVIDAGVVTGPISDDEVRRRGANGPTNFVAPGSNEATLAAAGFRVLAVEDRTAEQARTAAARLAAMRRHRDALIGESSERDVDAQIDYLEIVVALAERRALARLMYLAERQEAQP